MAETVSEICFRCVELISKVPAHILLVSLLSSILGFCVLVRLLQ